jgi:hypothetical protein
MATGKIVYYFEHGEIMAGICLSEKDNRYHLLLPGSKEINLQKKRALHLSAYTVDISLPKDVQQSIAAEKTVLQNKIAKTVCIPDLWESLKNKGQLYDISFLTKEIFKNKSNSDREMAVIRSIMNDHIHFKMNNLQFFANSLEQVEKLKIDAEKERKKEKEIIGFSKWVNLAIEKNTIAEKTVVNFSHTLSSIRFQEKMPPVTQQLKKL